MNTLLLIPAYNEEIYVGNVINNLKRNNVEEFLDILVIDDGSTDNTFNIVKKVGIEVVKNKTNMGVSYVYEYGVKYAFEKKYENVIFFDGDGQHDSASLFEMNEVLKIKPFVFGNRFCTGEIDNAPSSKLCSNYFASLLLGNTFNSKLKDVACGLKGGKVEHLKHIKPSSNFEYVYMILLQCLENRIEVIYVDTPLKYYSDELWGTKIIEIESLLKCILKYKKCPSAIDINYISECINSKLEFDITIQDAKFYFFYLKDYNSYIIQTEVKKAKKYFLGEYL